VERANVAFGHIAAIALSPAESAKKILAIVSEMATAQGGEHDT
jgi:hypothetical protein